MSLTEILTQHAAKATIAALVLGFFTGMTTVLRRGATNTAKLAMLQKDLQHRDELRAIEKENASAQLAAVKSDIATLRSEMQAGHREVENMKSTIMEKLNSMDHKGAP